MGNKIVSYKKRVEDELDKSFIHLERLNRAFLELNKKYTLPISIKDYENILSNPLDLALADQVIYRFSKLQDTIGAKLFKNFLLMQGENVNKPFLDILNRLEEIGLIDVERWFEIRDLRNEIAHEYENSDFEAVEIINEINELKDDLKQILEKIKAYLCK